MPQPPKSGNVEDSALTLDLRTRTIPSLVFLTNTEGSALRMYDHIFSKTAILDRWEEEEGG